MRRISTGDASRADAQQGDIPGEDDLDGVARRRLGDALDADDVAINRYRVPPGDSLPGGLHAHADQEEVFVVLAGTVAFEVLPDIDAEGFETRVSAGEAVRFPRGEFQSGRNDGDEPLVVLALGAPRDTEDVRVPVRCPACEAGALRLDVEALPPAFDCPGCGARRVADSCPDCDGDDLRIELAGAGGERDAGVVVTCGGCDATFDRPPVDGGW